MANWLTAVLVAALGVGGCSLLFEAGPKDSAIIDAGTGCTAPVDDPSFCETLALFHVLESPAGGAWAAADVFVHVTPAEGVTGFLECRSGKVDSESSLSEDFVQCGSNRFSPGLDPLLTGDGVYRTELRIAYPDGDYSEVLPLNYYLHQSLEGAAQCMPSASPEALFAKARERLPIKASDSGPVLTFSTTSEVTSPGFAQLANPFIRINFTPRASRALGFGDTSSSPNFGRSDGLLQPLSLRRSFQFNEDRSLVLITRRYAARRGFMPNVGCQAMEIQNSQAAGSKIKNSCSAVVLNREGAGVCLRVVGNNISFLFNPSPTFFSGLANTLLGETPLTDLVDNAMWRKIGRVHSPVPGTTAERASCLSSVCAKNGWSTRWGFANFSPKCYGDPTCTSELDALSLDNNKFRSIYLPDHELFRFE